MRKIFYNFFVLILCVLIYFRSGRSRAVFLPGIRQVQRKGAASTQNAFQRHISAVDAGNLLYHGQAEPGPGIFAACGVCLVKPLPDPVLLLRCNADAIIAHLQQYLTAFPAGTDPYMAAGPSVFKGIFHQIVYQAGEQCRICTDSKVLQF